MVVEVLFIEQRNGGVKVEPLAGLRIETARAVERFRVAYQNAQVAFGNGSRNAHRHLTNDAFATIGPQDCFNRDLVAWSRFRHICARAFEGGGMTVGLEIELE